MALLVMFLSTWTEPLTTCCVVQECIDQDSVEEKQVAVEAMDLVYSRAACSIALLDSKLSLDADVPALLALYAWGSFRKANRNLVQCEYEMSVWEAMEQILQLLGVISAERWLTRAWVVQEALSAGSNMFLLFEQVGSGPAVEPCGILRSDLATGQVVVHMDSFTSCVSWARELFTQCPPAYIRAVLPATEDRVADSSIEELFSLLSIQFVPALAGDERIAIGWQPRRSCCAAAALSFLRHRDNSVVEDRLSIFANMCDYDYRLVIPEVTRRVSSLSAALLALALLNGDYSLLIPEINDPAGTEPAAHRRSMLLSSDEASGKALLGSLPTCC